jgi:hypothetical protein
MGYALIIISTAPGCNCGAPAVIRFANRTMRTKCQDDVPEQHSQNSVALETPIQEGKSRKTEPRGLE